MQAEGTRYPELPELEGAREIIGEHPLRFLWTRSQDGRATHTGDSPELGLAFQRIAGIRDRWTLAVWYWAERVTRDRDHVTSRLRQRDVALVEDKRRYGDGHESYPWERDNQQSDTTAATEVPA